MSVLWCGGEDIDFSLGAAITVSTTGAEFRSGYARCAVYTNNDGVISKSSIFPGGAVTSAWLTARMFRSNNSIDQKQIGLGRSGTNSGLFIGTDSASSTKFAICKYDGTTTTQLANESGTSFSHADIMRLDMQVVNYGATATVNLYINGVLLVTYSGDVTVSGMTDFDSIYTSRVTYGTRFSEIIVANEDTRAFPGLLTMALTGDGTTTDWTGTFSTINGTTISDANPNYTNTNNLDQEFDVTNLPTGTFAIKAIKLAMRAAKAAGTPTQIALGYNEGGTVTVEGDIALTTAYATYEQLDLLNPRTSAAWDSSIINALQIDARSKA